MTGNYFPTSQYTVTFDKEFWQKQTLPLYLNTNSSAFGDSLQGILRSYYYLPYTPILRGWPDGWSIEVGAPPAGVWEEPWF